MLSYLSKPYPSIIEDGYKKSMVINFAVALVVFFILYAFKPTLFFHDNISFTLTDSLLFTGITFSVSFFYTNIITRIFPATFSSKNWTVGKEIGFLFLILISISIINFFVGRNVFYPEQNFEITTLLKVILATFIVGVIPMIVVVAFYLYFNQKRIAEKAITINESIPNKAIVSKTKEYQLKGSGKYEIITLKLNQLLFIESIGNYCDIYFLENEEPKKVTFRAALISFTEELPVDLILKTHRSYLVNLNKVERVLGNAQGYQLFLRGFDDKTIPVSRANIEIFDKYYS